MALHLSSASTASGKARTTSGSQACRVLRILFSATVAKETSYIKNRVINLKSDTFGSPIFQKVLRNQPFSLIISVPWCFTQLCRLVAKCKNWTFNVNFPELQFCILLNANYNLTGELLNSAFRFVYGLLLKCENFGPLYLNKSKRATEKKCVLSLRPVHVLLSRFYLDFILILSG